MQLILGIFVFISLEILTEGFRPCRNSSIDLSQNGISERRFCTDYDNNVFLKDGQPFQSLGAEFEYFRAHPKRWRGIFRTMRMGGLNTISTYIEWSFHNPYEGQYIWTGMANLQEFVRTAAEEGLLVMLRLGPYINAGKLSNYH